MHRVERLSEPESLKENKEKWTQKLLEQIEKKGSYSKVSSSYKSKYRQDDVKETLYKMYSGLCCFCESKVEVSGYKRIEHLKPKALPEFHHLSFEWENLNLCCEICNNKKSNKWNFENPIIDPSKDEPKEHLKFIYDLIGIKDNSLRGKTTKEHAGLNRDKLVEAREKILNKVMRNIIEIRQGGDISQKEKLKDELLLLVESKEPYYSFIQYLIDEFLDREWV